MRAIIRFAVPATLAIAAVGTSCGRRSSTPVPSVALVVQNRSFFDVNVYAVPSFRGSRMRLGTVTSFGSRVLDVPYGAQRAGGGLAVELHAVGSDRSYDMPELLVGGGQVACLEIQADATGDLSRSVFFNAIIADSIVTAGTQRSACGFPGQESSARGPSR